FSSSGRLRLPPEENPKGSHHLAGSNTKNAQLIIAIDLIYKKGKEPQHFRSLWFSPSSPILVYACLIHKDYCIII
ncbi:hypothetical protein ACTQ3L_09665, partial [Oscillospiraceae bacterium LCP25S3_E4]